MVNKKTKKTKKSLKLRRKTITNPVHLGGKSKRRTRKKGGDEKSIVAEPDTIFEHGKLYDINSNKGDYNYALFKNHRYDAEKTGEDPNVGENREIWSSNPIWFTYKHERMPGEGNRSFQRNEIAGKKDYEDQDSEYIQRRRSRVQNQKNFEGLEYDPGYFRRGGKRRSNKKTLKKSRKIKRKL